MDLLPCGRVHDANLRSLRVGLAWVLASRTGVCVPSHENQPPPIWTANLHTQVAPTSVTTIHLRTFFATVHHPRLTNRYAI